MASSRIDDPIRGVGLLRTTFCNANLSTTDSTYTQAGPNAGGIGAPAAPTGSNAPVRAEIEGLGDQDSSVVVEALRGGLPGLARGFRVGYRLASQATNQVRGWQPPNVITGCWSPAYGTTSVDSLDAVTLRNGKILTAHRTSAGVLTLNTFDPTTSTFTAETAPATCFQGVALGVDSQGFIYCVCRQPAVTAIDWSVYRTKAPDTTASGWTEISRDPFDTDPVSTTDKLRLAQLANGEWVMTGWYRNAVTGSIKQWASSDGCATFTQITSTTNLSASTIGDQVITPTSGKLGVVRVTTANVCNWHSTATAWQSAIAGSTAVQIATSVREAWACADPNGRIYVFMQSSASTDQVTVAYSDDEGASWTTMTAGFMDFDGDAGQFLTLGRAVVAMGDVHLFHQSSDNVGTSDNSPILLRLGGWSNVVMYQGGNPDDALGSGTGAGVTQCSWHPVSEPDDLSCWTAAGAGGDGADSFTAAGRLQINTVASDRYFSSTTAPTNAAGAGTLAGTQFRVTAGGSTTAFNSGFSIRASDGVNGSELRVWCTTTTMSIRSSAGGVATVTIDMTTDVQVLAWVKATGYAVVLYRRPYETTWTLAYESNAHATFATATGLVRWGHGAAATTTSEWSYFWHVSDTTSLSIGPLVTRLFSTFSSFLGPMGKPITGLKQPLGAGSQGTSNQRLLWVRAKDGPAVLGETWTIAPAYDYPISAIDPMIRPSPRVTWRSTSTAENAIGWELDPTYNTSITRNVALGLFNVNFPTAYLEAYNGATWDSIGTWDGRIGSGLSYTRSGNVLRINGGTALTRLIKRGELVGATVDLGGSKYRKIARHTEGLWSSANGKHVEIVLEGVDGTEAASGSSMAIWAKSGVLVVHGLSTLYRRWRLRIPSGSTATGYYEIGNVVPCEIVAWGRQHGRGYQMRFDPNADFDETPDLVSTGTQRGPVRRVVTWAWPDGVDRSRLQDSTPTPDYLSHSGTEGIANLNDVADQVAGLLVDSQSGVVPVIVLPSIPTTSGTMLTDPRLFMYARLRSNVGVENVLGIEATSELDRIAPITFEELV